MRYLWPLSISTHESMGSKGPMPLGGEGAGGAEPLLRTASAAPGQNPPPLSTVIHRLGGARATRGVR